MGAESPAVVATLDNQATSLEMQVIASAFLGKAIVFTSSLALFGAILLIATCIMDHINNNEEALFTFSSQTQLPDGA